jgi:hypothetical protein
MAIFKKKVNKDEIDWCPTQGGTYQAYVPEYFNGFEWVVVPLEASTQPANGIPQPKHLGGINQMLGLYGYDQALALAHWYAACKKAESYESVQVRAQRYEVIYSLKARKVDDAPQDATMQRQAHNSNEQK